MSVNARIALFAMLCLFALTGESRALTLGQAAQVAQMAQPAAFNTIELVAAADSQSRVPQWNRAKAALDTDLATLDACLQSQHNCDGQVMMSWREMMVSAQNQDEQTKLQAVNQFFNQGRYVSDQENYGVSEYWASPVQFMNNGGDCEDYAIAKYVSLKLLGYTDRQMRIMAVVDNSRGGIGHAVLAVATQDGKMIMDNQAVNVYNDAQQIAYTPRFSVNESGIYTYAVQPQLIMASME